YRYVEEDYCELVASPDGYTGVIRIPAFVTRRQIPVVGVGNLAFYGCKGVLVDLPFYNHLYNFLNKINIKISFLYINNIGKRLYKKITYFNNSRCENV
ncbi:MAG: hypothetical protein II670_05620, partial [Alphaproteobacteria bacterium]|nr:hypothetical protein [Alphaproteobacteria bacterium]